MFTTNFVLVLFTLTSILLNPQQQSNANPLNLSTSTTNFRKDGLGKLAIESIEKNERERNLAFFHTANKLLKDDYRRQRILQSEGEEGSHHHADTGVSGDPGGSGGGGGSSSGGSGGGKFECF